ncbi:A24 family peptidase [Marinobacter hydrocarbonoclasticus]|nr:A24 family peptidase [Marinobacter nauticus]
MDISSEFLTDLLTFVFFVTAMVLDLRTQRIPNALAVTALLTGLLVNTVAAGWSGLGTALLGAASALVLVPFYGKKWIGGGDVKLMIGIGALIGPIHCLWVVALAITCGALLVPLLATFQLGWRALGATAQRYYQCVITRTYVPPRPGEIAAARVPYAPAFAAGWGLTCLLHFPGL